MATMPAHQHPADARTEDQRNQQQQTRKPERSDDDIGNRRLRDRLLDDGDNDRGRGLLLHGMRGPDARLYEFTVPAPPPDPS